MEVIEAFLYSKELFERGRLQENFFIRNRVFSFHKVVLFIINLIRKSLQIELLRFTKIGVAKEATKQAFSKARRKLDPIIFVLMNHKLIQEFYTDNEIKTFRRFRVLAIDGSTVQLPFSNELVEHYGLAKNLFGGIPMARISTLYDVLNKVTIDSLIVPYKSSERDLAFEHIKNLLEINDNTNFNTSEIKDLFLFDRGYPSVKLLAMIHENKKDFVVRCYPSFVNVVDNAIKSGKNDQIIEIAFSDLHKDTKRRLRKTFPNFDVNKSIKVRVLLFKLKSGKQEILLTSLLDQKKYLPIDFFNLYSQRWDTEENYKFQKSIAAMENFSGKSKLTVEQDFFATIFTCNIASLLMQEALDEIIETFELKKYKYGYKINRNIGLSLLKDELIATIISGKDLTIFCEKVKEHMKKNLVPIRPGRSVSRPPCSRNRNRKFPTNKRPGM